MLLYYEYLHEKTNYFQVTQQKNAKFFKFTVYKKFSQLLDYSRQFADQEQVFLLDESRFDFFKFDILKYFENTCTISDINKLVDEKISHIKKEINPDSEVLFHTINTIFVDGSPAKFVIGQKGQIFMSLHLVYIKKKTLFDCMAVLWQIKHNKNITVIPESFYTQFFIKDAISKQQFNLLYIYDEYSKLVQIKDWFYKQFDTINLGINALKTIYQENNILPYLYKNVEDLDLNELAKDLVTKSLDFYAQMLTSRLQEKFGIGQDLIIISSIIKNTYFLDTLNKHYSKTISGYILPFHYSKKINTFQTNREPHEMDSLVYINMKKNSWK